MILGILLKSELLIVFWNSDKTGLHFYLL